MSRLVVAANSFAVKIVETELEMPLNNNYNKTSDYQ